ncbi:hypothetical protein AB0F17_53810 [Nonomuraea sp. NPDC026600]|uniref:hypothetical protein n=1 Tax=Nonomuraea sp. NPDC026600 TaxID=3155363 RepID=UPI0033C3B4D5
MSDGREGSVTRPPLTCGSGRRRPVVWLSRPANLPVIRAAVRSIDATRTPGNRHRYGQVAYGQLAAFSILYTAPAVILYVAVNKYLAGSFNFGGAMKG